METKIVLCPKCRIPNASGVSTCRGCGIRLCCQCNSAMPPQLGVCPQCGWWDPAWKSPLRETERDTSEQKPARVFTKKLDFKCTQCGAKVAHNAEKCTACGYVGHMQLRDKQSKASVAANATSITSTQNRSISTSISAYGTSKTRSATIRSEINNGALPTTKTNKRQSHNNKKKKTTENDLSWGYETKKSFPLWLLLAIIISVIIFIALTISFISWLNVIN